MKIAILESLGVSKARLEEEMQDLRSQGHTFVCYDRTTDTDALKAECADADAVILANMPFPADVIRESPNLKYIDVAFTGVDHVGLDAARERQIPVSNASGYSTRAVSELAVGMMLSLLRNLPAQEAAARRGGTKAGIGARELAGKTVGIVGTGKIGLYTARILSAFSASFGAAASQAAAKAAICAVASVPARRPSSWLPPTRRGFRRRPRRM